MMLRIGLRQRTEHLRGDSPSAYASRISMSLVIESLNHG